MDPLNIKPQFCGPELLINPGLNRSYFIKLLFDMSIFLKRRVVLLWTVPIGAGEVVVVERCPDELGWCVWEGIVSHQS